MALPWRKKTEAKYTHDTHMHEAAKLTLRLSLNLLVVDRFSNPEHKRQTIYAALMAASSLGYQCGVTAFDGLGDKFCAYAVIELPTGRVAFEFEAWDVIIFTAYIDDAEMRILKYLEGEE